MGPVRTGLDERLDQLRNNLLEDAVSWEIQRPSSSRVYELESVPAARVSVTTHPVQGTSLASLIALAIQISNIGSRGSVLDSYLRLETRHEVLETATCVARHCSTALPLGLPLAPTLRPCPNPVGTLSHRPLRLETACGSWPPITFDALFSAL